MRTACHLGRPEGRPTIALIVFALAMAACSVDETPAPPLAGPSEFALGIVVHASPDSILQDGIAQSEITIEAKGPDGRPVPNVSLRLAIRADGVPAEFGILSTKSTVTADDGRARVTYTAPVHTAEAVGTTVTIAVTPVGNDFRGEQERQVDIRVMPPGVLVPPIGTIAPAFTVSPSDVTPFTQVTFDASGTTNDGVACAGRCTYTWNFGDGGSATGIVVTHEFREVGTFPVRLTVRDARGFSGTVTQTVSVGGGQLPTAAFTFSPSNPLPGETIFFNASGSFAVPGRSIVRYDWDFGSGRTGEGVTVSKAYNTASAYVVTLKVTDDANQVGTTTQTVTVGGGSITPPTASFVFSPTTPLAGQPVFFDAGGSRAGAGRSITAYRWNFGDGTTAVGNKVVQTYGTAGSFVVSLTVVDDQGQEGTSTQTVQVGGAPTAAFTFSPTDPAAGVTVLFNASTSQASPGRQLVSYGWDFGDANPPMGYPNQATGETPSHRYTLPGTYVVTLTVTDDAQLVGRTSLQVVVTP